jgi:RNA polymerase sigma-54 factor
MSSLKLQPSLKQQMILTPQLRQRIEMLQMTSLELSDLIQQEILSNPILEEVQSGEEVEEISAEILDQNAGPEESDLQEAVSGFSSAGEEPGPGADEGSFEDGAVGEEVRSSDPFEEIDFGREFQDYLDPGYRTQEFEFKEDGPGFEHFVSRGPSLQEHLLWQVGMLSIGDVENDACSVIIGNLDEDGRLTSDVAELAIGSGHSEDLLERARNLVMALDPVGCGARDVRECLVAQLLERVPEDDMAVMLVRNHLPDLQPHKLNHLAKVTGLSFEEISEQLGVIKGLDPYPGRRFSSEDPVYISPEVYIEEMDGEFVIYFPDDGSPRLRISSSYQKMLGEKSTNKETKEFIREKVRSAVDLLRNIEHRRQTIYKVVDCIIRRQGEYLRHGVQYLKPMMLKDVAEDIGMHLSTISRVVNRKYAHTPQGVIELRKFFSEGMMNEDGEEVSTRILKLKIKKMIEDEDTTKPLTDDQIAKMMMRDGVRLSRRTIAKYRDQMRIPGSRERRTVI